MRSYKILDQNGMYFLTTKVMGWIDAFTRKQYRDIVIDSLRFCQEKKGLELYAYVIMSNHIHLIARAKEGCHLSGVLRDFKKFTANQILNAIHKPRESRRNWMLPLFEKYGWENTNNRHFQFWEQDNHPIELWSEKVTLQKLDYIHYNPVKAGIVESPEAYIYSSASNYAFGKGILEVELLYSVS